MKSKKFLTILTFIVILFGNISNSQSIEPDVFVQSTVNRASEALNSKYSKEEKIDKLKSIAKETVDIKGIGFYTLGAYRKEMTESQKEEYKKLFEEMKNTEGTLSLDNIKHTPLYYSINRGLELEPNKRFLIII